jgi:hypothetical protein
LRQAFIEVPQLTEEPGELYRIPISSWPPFIVKVDALSLGKVTTDYLSEPAQTVVDNAGLDFPANPVQQLAWVIYELLGGVRPAPAFDGAVQRLNPVPNLSEPGNVILRIGATEPGRFIGASDFLSDLENSEVHNQPAAVFSAANPAPPPASDSFPGCLAPPGRQPPSRKPRITSPRPRPFFCGYY